MGLQLHLRKLTEDSIAKGIEDLCEPICNSSARSISACKSPCLSLCPYNCLYIAPPAVFTYDHPSKPRKFLIIALTIFAVTFIALCCYIIYFKFYLRRRASRRRSQPQTEETHDDFIDEDQGPVVDHHIWYINTVGLQPSVISAITVCKYKKADGLVEGTECSVCLNEFQEDETLRLLPKCSHAFHIPCIDTWLRSHTNCPMCRAPIVKIDTATASSSSDSNTDNSAISSGTQVNISDDNGETDRELEEGVLERTIITEQGGELHLEHRRSKRCESSEELSLDKIQPIRRSVSMDSLSASKLTQGLANYVISEETEGNSGNPMAKEKDSFMKIVQKRVTRNEGLSRLVGSSSTGRSLQIGPVSFNRSFSCSGKFLLPRRS